MRALRLHEMKKLIIVITVLFFCISANSQERRLALIVGNGNYPTSTLSNPENDAKSMEKSLKALGFKVIRHENLTQKKLTQAIDDFGNKLKYYDVGLFFYAGHGIQAKGFNYLIPVDAVLKAESDVEYNCVRADRIFGKMEEAQNDINIIILDACRDNPFERSWTRAARGRGLTFMDAPGGSIIAYATAPGKTASDGYGKNSPYTSALIQCMEIPNIKIEDFLKKVRAQVREQTKSQQTPWESTSLEGDFYFHLDANQTIQETQHTDATQPVDNSVKELKRTAAPEIKSMAILPFANYSGDESKAYLAMGMQDALISEIGQLGTIRVISKTSTLSYTNTQKTIQEIAYELNVDAIMEASIMTLQNNIRLHLKLYSAYPEERQIWSQTFDSDLSNIFNLYNEVIKTVANEIQLSLSPEQQNQLEKTRQVNTEAYDAYLMGQFYFYQITPEGFQKALEYFNLAIEKDPDWGPPYAGMALYWIGMRQIGLEKSSITIPNIYKYLDKAVDLNPNSANTHYVNALAAVWTGFDWEKGEREFLKALEINPNHALCRGYFAALLLILGRTDEAYEQGKLSVELDPLNPQVQGLFTGVLLERGEYDEVISLAKKIPNNPAALTCMEAAYYYQGDYQNSIKAMMQLNQYSLDKETISDINKTYEAEGYKAALEDIVCAMEEKAQNSVVWPFDIVYYYRSELNKPAKTLELLEKGFEIRDPGMPFISISMLPIDYIRDNPRFIELLKKMNLPLGEFE